MKVRSDKAKWSTPLPRPIAILDQDDNGTPIPGQHLLTLHTLDVRGFLKRIPRQKRGEAKWLHVEAMLRKSPEDTAVALQLALQLERLPYRVGE
jgi:hypothetical protein